MKRPVAKQTKQPSLMSASLTMRPLARKGNNAELDRLGVEQTSAPKTQADPRIVAFEAELRKRKTEEQKVAARLASSAITVDEKQTLQSQLDERKAQEQLLRAELEQLRKQVEESTGTEDPCMCEIKLSFFFDKKNLDLAQLEAEISTLKFAALSHQESFEEQKQQLLIAQEKAEQLDAAVEKMERMESFLNEIQEERNAIHASLQVAEQQIKAMSKMVVTPKPSDEEMQKVVAPLNRQIADLVRTKFV
jgi:uncharacterized protein (UPF0335 family)